VKVDELTNGGKGWYISRLSSRIVESSDTCRQSGSVRHIDDENAIIGRARGYR